MNCKNCNNLDEWKNENDTPMATCKLDGHQVRTSIETCDEFTDKVLPCKIGDIVYHIDTGIQIWEFIIVRIEENVVYVVSNDELQCRANFEMDKMPMPRLFYKKEDAELAQADLSKKYRQNEKI